MDAQLYELLNHCTLRLTIAHKQGTGFFVAPGLVVTCAHVVKEHAHSAIEAVWNGRAYPARLAKYAPIPDLALLSLDLKDHPCVYLREGAAPFDRLYSYGYSDERPTGEPIVFMLEGKAGDQEEELKFQSGQVRPGISGAPLLNTQTGGVCGIVRLSRDRSLDLGGRAIPTALLLRTFPELVDLQTRFHEQDKRWVTHLSSAWDERARIVSPHLIDQRDYVQDRLTRFVGRSVELAELRRRIAEKSAGGGYVLLTGETGQGKSSIIARMVEEQGREDSAYHFVQEGSGANFSINVVRNLMARLILKYDLPEYYVAGESYEILCGNFLGVLQAIAKRPGRETIFIDGLDQLDKGSAAVPDLNFLPARLPAGIVIVLGTRPNETLEAIRTITHIGEREPYDLPGLSREDFALLLEKHEVPQRAALSDSLYRRLTDNPLYLDLVAQELHTSRGEGAEALIARVASNPNDIFTITFSRMKELPEWDDCIRPMLGVLLVSQEPLTAGQIAHIIKQQGWRVRAGITRLGGLLAQAGQQRVHLFHPKLKEYLRQSSEHAGSEIPFDAEEEERLHGLLADWCEQGPLEQLWGALPDPTPQDDYQEYAQQHYLLHLHASRRRERLFSVLNDGGYEREKLRADPSTRSTAQDLLLGCQAAARGARTLDEGKQLLPNLWRYTLLRTSLTTRADAYPLTAFQALLALQRRQEALDLAELLTRPDKKLAVLNLIAASLLKHPAHISDGEQLVSRIYDSATAIQDQETRSAALKELAATLIQTGRLAQAEEVARLIANERDQLAALNEISVAYGARGDWQQARTVALAIAAQAGQVKALSHLAALRKLAHETAEAETLWQESSASAAAITDDMQRSQALFSLSASFLHAHEWQRALFAARAIPLPLDKVGALSQVASALTRADEASGEVWEEAREAMAALDEQEKPQAERIYATAQIQAGLFDDAEHNASRYLSEHPTEKVRVFGDLAKALLRERQWERSRRVITQIVREYDLSDVDASLLDNTLVHLSIELAQSEQWEQARETAQAIAGREARCSALMGIVNEQARAGEAEQARQNWEEASVLCRAQADAVQSGVAAILVAALVATGEREQARRIVSMLPDRHLQEEVKTALAQALVRAGQIAEAEEVRSAIASPSRKADILRSIAQAQMEAGQFEQAVATAQAIPDVGKRSRALLDLVEGCCHVGQWDRAQAIADQIPSEPLRAEALDRLIVGLVRARQEKRAERIARAIGNDYFKANSLCTLATALAQMGSVAEARRLAHSIRRNPRIQRKTCCQITIAASLFGVSMAEIDARAIEASSERDEALCSVAAAYARERSWTEAEKIVEEISSRRRRDEAWTAIAVERANAEEWTGALASFGNIQRNASRFTVLRAWGTMLARSDRQAIREHIVQHLTQGQEKAELLMSVAAELAKTGNDLEQIRLIQHAWLQARTKDDCRELFALTRQLLPRIPETCMEFAHSFEWVDSFQTGP